MDVHLSHTVVDSNESLFKAYKKTGMSSRVLQGTHLADSFKDSLLQGTYSMETQKLPSSLNRYHKIKN